MKKLEVAEEKLSSLKDIGGGAVEVLLQFSLSPLPSLIPS
ncbi:hypothetical protein TIFTF001_025491 [Ficus carica]|uniref:Uncharacterized protein n=1 Tax=Ficus carica TaxID=3494 RepID=A0AA88AN00_FICCA|nr:hypothetical protein TIFTF001_025491 [Ficus carica]